MIKFGFVFLALLVASALGSLIGTNTAELKVDEPSVARNQRLTASTGLVIYVLLIAIAVTVFRISSLLTPHYVIGFLLLPPVILKMGSTGYRFASYYSGNTSFRLAGTPPTVLRFLVAPVLVVSTVVVFATGVELWLFGLRYGSGWIAAHTVSAVVMILAASVHVLAHFRRSGGAAAGELSARRPGALSSRSLLVASVVTGAVLAVAPFFYASPFTASVAGG